MSFLAHIASWLSAVMNALASVLLAPVVQNLPGWLSNTIVSALTGVVVVVIFKYTSNQRAIGLVKDNIKANMLALRLFKDSLGVTFQSIGRLFRGAGMWPVHAILPMLVMIVPFSLLSAQLCLWYQARPLEPGETTWVMIKLNGKLDSPWPAVSLEPSPAVDVRIGAVQVKSKREIYWEIEAREKGNHGLVFHVGQDRIEKQIAIGQSFMPVSVERPGWQWASILRHPHEKPFSPDGAVQSITISYPDRPGWSSGTNYWLIYFIVASMAFAMVFKPFLKVKI